ncbi:MAG: hypothetical protein Q9187_001735 [Circinaria calcarea]
MAGHRLWKFLILHLTWAAIAEASDSHLVNASKTISQTIGWSAQYSYGFVKAALANRYSRMIHGHFGIWDMAQLLAACSILPAFRLWRKRTTKMEGKASERESISERKSISGSTRHSGIFSGSAKNGTLVDPSSTDPGLLRKHSTFKTYRTNIATYPSIRTFYRPHPQADKLPDKPTPLPLLVFVHGLGGSLAQFHPLLTSLVNVAPCLGIDLPGCGLSQFSPKAWEAYSPEALTELLRVVIEEHCDRKNDQGVILIGHSMGCSLSAYLASTSSVHAQLTIKVLGLIVICPRVSTPTRQQIVTFRRILQVPTLVFDLWRKWDRRGGTQSASVTRFVGQSADIETKKLQEKFNSQSQTAVWRRMAWGIMPIIRSDGSISGGLPGPEIWTGVAAPLYLIAGEADNVTKPEEIAILSKLLGKVQDPISMKFKGGEAPVPDSAGGNPQANDPNNKESADHDEKHGLGLSTTETTLLRRDAAPSPVQARGNAAESRHRQVLKTSILPSPANHALLYDNATYRTLAGLIQAFLAEHIDARLSLGWQLQHLSTEGKWDVKNLQKWQAVTPVSEPIGGIFRAMKTLREIDEKHSPAIFVKDWKDKIKAVIDISHESPCYDPRGLEAGGIEYHKFPTVSKIPPTSEEVRDFIGLVDRLREQQKSKDDLRLIGVHCHYGFNRTGFFVCSYLIEKGGFTVQQAIEEFQAKRPPGIRHDHFIDTLFVRYCVGLKRAPTL